MATPIGTIGLIPNLVVDTMTFTDLTNILFLSAATAGTSPGSDFYGTLRISFTTSGHQIATGKTFTAFASVIDMFSVSGSGTGRTFLIAGGNDVGESSGTAPTMTAAPPGVIDIFITSSDVRGISRSFAPMAMAYNIFATTFPTIQFRPFGTLSGNVSFRIYGYEM